MDHHVHRTRRSGPCVLISEPWHKLMSPVRLSGELCVAEHLSHYMVCLPVYADANDRELSEQDSVTSELFGK